MLWPEVVPSLFYLLTHSMEWFLCCLVPTSLLCYYYGIDETFSNVLSWDWLLLLTLFYYFLFWFEIVKFFTFFSYMLTFNINSCNSSHRHNSQAKGQRLYLVLIASKAYNKSCICPMSLRVSTNMPLYSLVIHVSSVKSVYCQMGWL